MTGRVLGRSLLVGLAMAAGLSAMARPATAQLGKQSAGAAAANEVGFGASAFGTEVSVAGVVSSGRSALSILGCTSTPGVTHTNEAADVNTAVVRTGTIDTSAASEATVGGVASAGSSTIQNVSILGGLVTATALRSDSTTSYSTATHAFAVSATGTEFVGLSVAGTAVSGSPPPNTRLTLPGVGYVVLNAQDSHVGAASARLGVIAILVVVDRSTPLAPVGTRIVVGSAESQLTAPITGLLRGYAYGARANVDGTVTLGRAFPQPLPCLGTDGKTKSNSGASVHLGSLLSSGTITDTAEGRIRTRLSAEVTSTVQDVNLAGVVSATAVRADVTAVGNPPRLGDKSGFLSLTVSGFPSIGDNVAPNTRLALPGLGVLWLHRVIQTPTSIQVVMIELRVTAKGNSLGVPVGTVVDVASATVGVK